MVKNGDKVKHRITGIVGVVMGITDWLYGCQRVHVLPFALKDGRPQEYIAFDAPELEIIEAGFMAFADAPKPIEPKKKATGGARNYRVTK